MTTPSNVEQEERGDVRTGRVAIVGRPNVGKSTLLNSVLGQKLVIATARPGTTRASVLGIYLSADPPTQIAFVDTPGLHRPKSALGKHLVQQAQAGLSGVDAVLLLVEAPRPRGQVELDREDERILELVLEIEVPVVVAINKIDRLAQRDRLLPLIGLLDERVKPAAIVPISARKGVGLDRLITALRDVIPAGELEDDEALTDRPERFFVAELIREAAIRNTRDEVPHGISVLIERFEEGAITRISAILVVEKESHKGIVIGKNGARLKTIGTEARGEIERFLDRRVHLELWVKVVTGWTDDPLEVRRLTGDEP